MAELELLAERDALTGLPNTRVFERAIGDRLGRDEAFALLVGDVDSFAGSRGTLQADDVLREVASRLLHSLRPGDEVARVGDDEFAVLTYAASAGDARKVAAASAARARRRRVRRHVRLGGVPAGRIERALALPRRRRALYARRMIHRQAMVIPLPEPASADGRA